jgi:hypothetical protein
MIFNSKNKLFKRKIKLISKIIIISILSAKINSCNTLSFQEYALEYEPVLQDISFLLEKMPIGITAQKLNVKTHHKLIHEDSLGRVYRNIFPIGVQYDTELYFRKGLLTSIIINLECNQENKTKLLYLRWVEHINQDLKAPAQGNLGNYYWNVKKRQYSLRLHPSQKIISFTILARS